MHFKVHMSLIVPVLIMLSCNSVYAMDQQSNTTLQQNRSVYTCITCALTFNTLQEHSRHYDLNHRQTNVQCNKCKPPKRFINRLKYNLHKKEAHTRIFNLTPTPDNNLFCIHYSSQDAQLEPEDIAEILDIIISIPNEIAENMHLTNNH